MNLKNCNDVHKFWNSKSCCREEILWWNKFVKSVHLKIYTPSWQRVREQERVEKNYFLWIIFLNQSWLKNHHLSDMFKPLIIYVKWNWTKNKWLFLTCSERFFSRYFLIERRSLMLTDGITGLTFCHVFLFHQNVFTVL